jgi:hypothetical protein
MYDGSYDLKTLSTINSEAKTFILKGLAQMKVWVLTA